MNLFEIKLKMKFTHFMIKNLLEISIHIQIFSYEISIYLK